MGHDRARRRKRDEYRDLERERHLHREYKREKQKEKYADLEEPDQDALDELMRRLQPEDW